MNKIISLLALFIGPWTVKAATGVVIALNAPLVLSPKLHQPPVQELRKGETLFIHDKHLRDEMGDDAFYETVDRLGRVAYIPKRFVKLITKNESEYDQSITFSSHDPTDYRLVEPLNENYPFYSPEKYRLNFAFVIGSDAQNSYEEKSSPLNQSFSYQLGGKFILSKKLTFDKSGRSYFGVIGLFSASTSEFEFSTLAIDEAQTRLGIGPYYSYDIYRSINWNLLLGGGFTVNYHLLTSDRNDRDPDPAFIHEEERTFSGFSLSPLISLELNRKITQEFQLIGGFDFQAFLPYSVSDSSTAQYEELWDAGHPNSFEEDLTFNGQFYLGMRAQF